MSPRSARRETASVTRLGLGSRRHSHSRSPVNSVIPPPPNLSPSVTNAAPPCSAVKDRGWFTSYIPFQSYAYDPCKNEDYLVHGISTVLLKLTFRRTSKGPGGVRVGVPIGPERYLVQTVGWPEEERERWEAEVVSQGQAA